MTNENDNLVLISGESATGKSASLMQIDDPAGVYYGNCENNKKLPFKSGFQEFNITNNSQVYELFEHAETNPNIHTIIIDSLTYMMDMYETNEVIPAPDGRAAWGNYAQYFKILMNNYVAKSTKNVIFTGHTLDEYDDKNNKKTRVKVKGSLMNNGIESFFSTVISTKKVPLKVLENYGSDLLNITEEEEMLGYKHCFQTRPTKDTVSECIRSPMLMWDISETYIDNNVQNVINRLHEFYK